MAQHEHLFLWPHSEPQSVIVTGTFDEWRSSVHLQRDANNQFSGKVKLPSESTVLYKYVVDGHWTTHDSQPKETDSSGNVNNVLHTPSATVETQNQPNAHADIAAPLKEAADAIQAPDTSAINNVIAAATGAGEAALAAVAAAVGIHHHEKSAEGAPVNDAASSPVAAITPEKPTEPAPTPAPLKDVKSQASLPTVPSGEDLQAAVAKDPQPHSASTPNGPLLTGLAPIEDNKPASSSAKNAVEAAGPNAAESGPAEGQPFLPLTENAGTAATSKTSAPLPPGLKSESPLPAVKGVEVYKPDGSIGKDAAVAVAAPAKSAKKVSKKPVDAATTSKASEVVDGEKKIEPAKETPAKKKSSTPKAAAAATPAAAEGDVFKPVGTPAATPKKGKEVKANGEKVGTAAPPKESPKNLSRKSVPAAPLLDNTAPDTPARDEYKTAPSTPADTPAGLKAPGGGQIPRTTSSSFFGKLRSSLSPSKKK